MTATGVPLGNVVIALAFAAAAAAATMAVTGVPPGDKVMRLRSWQLRWWRRHHQAQKRRGKSSQHCSVAWRELDLIKLCKY
jgi:hypothetical protein